MGRPPIQDEFTALPVATSLKYRYRCYRDGKCIRCGKPRVATSTIHCAAHEKKHREEMRCRKWRPGSCGRIPNWAKISPST